MLTAFSRPRLNLWRMHPNLAQRPAKPAADAGHIQRAARRAMIVYGDVVRPRSGAVCRAGAGGGRITIGIAGACWLALLIGLATVAAVVGRYRARRGTDE
jgi:hypothetical protein